MTNTAELKRGDKLRDNDPRMRGRELTITQVFPNGVAAVDSMGKTRIYLLKRIFFDGKPRRYGLNKI